MDNNLSLTVINNMKYYYITSQMIEYMSSIEDMDNTIVNILIIPKEGTDTFYIKILKIVGDIYSVMINKSNTITGDFNVIKVLYYTLDDSDDENDDKYSMIFDRINDVLFSNNLYSYSDINDCYIKSEYICTPTDYISTNNHIYDYFNSNKNNTLEEYKKVDLSIHSDETEDPIYNEIIIFLCNNEESYMEVLCRSIVDNVCDDKIEVTHKLLIQKLIICKSVSISFRVVRDDEDYKYDISECSTIYSPYGYTDMTHCIANNKEFEYSVGEAISENVDMLIKQSKKVSSDDKIIVECYREMIPMDLPEGRFSYDKTSFSRE